MTRQEILVKVTGFLPISVAHGRKPVAQSTSPQQGGPQQESPHLKHNPHHAAAARLARARASP